MEKDWCCRHKWGDAHVLFGVKPGACPDVVPMHNEEAKADG